MVGQINLNIAEPLNICSHCGEPLKDYLIYDTLRNGQDYCSDCAYDITMAYQDFIERSGHGS